MNYYQITLILSLSLLTVTQGRPQVSTPTSKPSNLSPSNQNGTVATILKSDFENNGDGSFQWSVETSDGFRAEQSGHTDTPNHGKSDIDSGEMSNENGGGEVVKGSYSYKAPDGQLISVTYIADSNGFQPMGSHIPTVPPNPFKSASAAATNATVTSNSTTTNSSHT